MTQPLLGESRRDLRQRLKARKPAHGKRGAAPTEIQERQRAKRLYGICERLLATVLTVFGPSCADFIGHMRTRTREALEILATDFGESVKPAIEAAVEAQRVLERFCEIEGIERDPERVGDRQLHFGILALVLVFEALSGLYIMSQAAPSPFHAAFAAFLPVGVNALCAFFAALSIGQLRRRFRRARVLGGVGVVSISSSAVVVQFLAAHSRDRFAAQMLEGGDATGPSLAQQIANHPFSLSSDATWFLIAGIVAFVLCTYEFRRADDPHPKLGKRVRDMDRAAEAARSEVSRIERAMVNVFHSVATAGQDMLERTEATVREALELSAMGLRQLGVGDPTKVDLAAEADRDLLELATRYRELTSWMKAIQDLGDVRTRLSQREDSGPEGPVYEVERLSDACSAEEAREWLYRAIAAIEDTADQVSPDAGEGRDHA